MSCGLARFQSHLLAICVTALVSASLPFATLPFSSLSSSSFQFESLVWAQTTGEALTKVSSTDFDPICQAVLASSADSTSAGATDSQKYQYCQAALASKKASDAANLVWKVWAAVGAVCAAACAASFAGMAVSVYACPGATLGASAADVVITKNYMSSMMGIMAAGGAIMTRQISPPTDPSAAEAKTQPDLPSCMLSANAAFMAFSNHSRMLSSRTAMITSLEAAQAIASNGTTVTNTQNTTAILGNTNSGSLLTTGSMVNTVSPGVMTSSGYKSSNGGCVGSSTVMTQCAIASDSTLPKFAGTPRFAADFKKVSGQNLQDFMTRDSTPKKALVAAMSGPLSTDQSMMLSAAVQKMEQQISQSVPSATYAGGGHGGGSKQESGDPALGDMLSGMMAQFGAKPGDNPAQSGLSNVIFANQNPQKLATLAEDQTLSLFDRITYRYYYVSNRMSEEP